MKTKPIRVNHPNNVRLGDVVFIRYAMTRHPVLDECVSIAMQGVVYTTPRGFAMPCDSETFIETLGMIVKKHKDYHNCYRNYVDVLLSGGGDREILRFYVF